MSGSAWDTTQAGRPSSAAASSGGGGPVFKKVSKAQDDAVFRRAKGPALGFTMREGGESDTDSHVSLQPVKRKRVMARPAWEGGTQVDEERFLAALAENTRLKKELTDKEDRTRKLLTQLARAEEAAKRAIVKETGSSGGGGRSSRVAGANASKLFEQEKVIVELREKLRIMTTARDREHERALHFKAMAREYKLRLDSMAAENRKLQRADRSRHQTGFNGDASFADDDMAAMHREITILREENRALSSRSPVRARAGAGADVEIRSLQAKLREYEAQLASVGRATGGQGGRGAQREPSRASQALPSALRHDGEWYLEEYPYQGNTYLLDRATGRLYNNASEGEWPVAVGSLVHGEVRMASAPKDFFQSLDAYLKSHKARLREVFDHFDGDKNGQLDRKELGRLCKDLMPDVSAPDVRYFQAMLDADGDGKITYDEIIGAIKDAVAAGDAARNRRAPSSSGGPDILSRIRKYMVDTGSSARKIFAELDTNGNGQLEDTELRRLIKRMVPDVRIDEMRHMFAELRLLDVDGDGRISFSELQHALRVGSVRRGAAGSGPGAVPAAAERRRLASSVSFTGTGDWVLEEIRHDGHAYLIDPRSRKVYGNCKENEYPVAVGWIDSGDRIHLAATPKDFFQSLDAYLKSHKARLREVFDHFDGDKNGQLDRKELGRLCKDLMPDVSAPDVRYFQAMLDADGDGKITYDEIIGAIKESMAAGEASRTRRGIAESFLSDLGRHLRENTKSVQQLFEEADRDGNGWLSQQELLQLVRKVAPGTSTADQRLLLSELRRMDVSGDGRITFRDFYEAVRAGRVVRRSGDRRHAPAVEDVASRAAIGSGSAWVLEEISFEGTAFLLDPRTKKVYKNCREDQWPLPIGKLQGGAVVLSAPRVEFFVALDEYLKRQGTRLKDLFNEFDREGTGALDRKQLQRLFRRLVSSVTDGQVGYAMALLDTDGDGKVTYDELLQAIRDCVAAGQAVRSDRGAGGAGDVLGKLRDYLREKHMSAQQLFSEFDTNHNGFLESGELVRLLRRLVPDVTPRELRYLLTELDAADLDGDGRISYEELRRALRLSRPERQARSAPPPPSPAKRPGHVPNYEHRASEHGSGPREVQQQYELEDLRAKLAEIPLLHRDLADARAAMAEMQAALAMGDGPTVRRSVGGSGAGSLASSREGELGGELKKAWERVGVLQQRYQEVQEALTQVKGSHERVIKQLDDTHKRLNGERKANLKLEAENRRLDMELEGAREVQPLLDQARSEQLRLEKENHSLLAKAMAAPTSALAEMRAMRTAVAEQQRERAAAELREAELRREMVGLSGGGGGAGGEDAHILRMERDTAKSELARTRLDLEEAREKLKVYAVMGYAPTPSDPGTPGKPWGERRAPYSAHANLDADKSDEEVRSELAELREQYAEHVDELRKAQKLLRLEEAQAEDLKHEVEELHERHRLAEGELRRKLEGYERELDRKQEKIYKLEASLNRTLYGGKSVRASAGGRSEMVDDDDAASIADLPEGENLFELVVAGATLEGQALGEDPTTFLTFDFYEHETQATPVVTGLSPQYGFTVQYEVRVDSFFLEYLDTHELRVELNRASGVDFTTLGVSMLPLKMLLRDQETGEASGRRPVVHYADIHSVGGKLLGRLRYSLRMRRPIASALREYRELARLEGGRKKGKTGADPLEAAAAAADPLASTGVQVVVTQCTGLRAKKSSGIEAVPYVSYKFPGFKEHDTPFGKGSDPRFDDIKLFPLHRSTALEQRLRKSTLDVHVFDDADLDITEAGLIGTAKVPIAALADGLPVQGKYPLYNPHNEVTGHVHIDMTWYQPDDPMRRPPGSPPAARRPLALVAPSQPDPRRRSDESDRSELLPAERGSREEMRPGGGELAARQTRVLGVGGVAGGSGSLRGHRRGMSGERSPPRSPGLTLPSRDSLHSHSHSRYSERDSMEGWGKGSEVGRSIEGMRRSGAGLPLGLPPLEENIIISVNSVQLGSESFNDPNIRHVFVLFEFLPDFSRDEDQCTGTLAKTQYELKYAFTRAFSVGAAEQQDRKKRYKVNQMMRAPSPDEAAIPICLVSEEGDDLREFAFAEANLLDLYESGGDWVERTIDMRDDRGIVVAQLNLTVLAYQALRSIMRDTGPP